MNTEIRIAVGNILVKTYNFPLVMVPDENVVILPDDTEHRVLSCALDTKKDAIIVLI